MKSFYSILFSILALISYSQNDPGRNLIPLYDSTNSYIFSKTINDWKVFRKTKLYEYDERGNILKYTHFRLVNLVMTPNERFTNTYASNNSILTSKTESYDSQGWENSTMETNTYNSAGFHTKYLLQLWKDEEWSNSNEINKTYDSVNNLIKYVTSLYVWSVPKIEYQEVREYNELNQITLLVKYPNPHLWPYDSTNYNYDENDRLSTEVFNFISDETLEWDKIIWAYSYNELDQVISIVLTRFYNGIPEEGYRKTFTYDEIGNQLTSLYQRKSNDVWVNDELESRVYTEDGHLQNILKESWKNSKWNKEYEYRYYYDQNNLLIGECDISYSNDSIESADSTAYYFESVLGTPESINNIQTNIYPNPTTGIFSLQSNKVMKDIYVYSTSGEKLLYLPHARIIDITKFPPGLYILRATSGKASIYSKIMKL